MYDHALDEFVPEAAELNATLRLQPAMSGVLAHGPAGIEQMRSAGRERLALRQDPPVPDEIVSIGVPVRVFRAPRPRGIYVSLHGGGWMFGSAEGDDLDSARIAQNCDLTVLSVEYRLVPDVDWRTAIADCQTAIRHAIDHGEREFGAAGVIVGGFSAGATLAVDSLLRLRDEGSSLQDVIGANLHYGVYDFARTPSQRAWKDTLIIDPGYWQATRPVIFPGTTEDDRRDPSISPLYADLHGLPPALFSVGNLDPFLDDSLFMAQRWRAAGNIAELAVYPESPHGFDSLPTAMAAASHERTDAFLRSLLP